MHAVAAMEVVAALAAVPIQVLARLEVIVMGGIAPVRHVSLENFQVAAHPRAHNVLLVNLQGRQVCLIARYVLLASILTW